MTSAPRSPSSCPQKGPASSVPSSRTRRSDSGPLLKRGSVMAVSCNTHGPYPEAYGDACVYTIGHGGGQGGAATGWDCRGSCIQSTCPRGDGVPKALP